MPKETYAHEDVTLICSSGMMPSKLAVAERRVSIAKGKKIATELDKPFNFMCKWMGILAALLAGIICAAMAVPFLAALVIGLIAGAVGAGLGGTAFCMFMLLYSPWNNPHSKVKIGNIKALTEGATLNCAIGGGSIQMFFSPEMAAEQLKINRIKNVTEIAGAAFMGRGLYFLYTSIAGAAGFAKITTALTQSLILLGWTGVGYGLSEGANVLANRLNKGDWSEWDRDLGKSIPFVYLNDEKEDEEKSWQDKSYEVLQNDYAKPFTEPLNISDETKISSYNEFFKKRKKLGPLRAPVRQLNNNYSQKYQGLQTNETVKFKTENSIESYRKMTDGELDKYAKEQKQQFKKDNPVHKYKNKKNKKLQGRQKRNQQKLNRRANQHAAVQRQNQLDKDYNQAQKTRHQDAVKHGKGEKIKMFKRDRAHFKAKFTRRHFFNKAGSFAGFFLSDVLTKTMQKSLDDILLSKGNPELKAKAGVKVVALKRM